MAEIGKSLVFYLKYYPEMQHLYSEDKRLAAIDNDPDRDAIKKKVDAVGHAAGIEARRLLEACVSQLQLRFTDSRLARLESRQRQATIEQDWQICLEVRPRKKRSFKRTQIGVTLHREGLIPWVWTRGGLAVEEKIKSCFANGVTCYGSKEFFEWSGGSVGLETVTVPWKKAAKDFTLKADGVIAQTQRVLEAINASFMRRLIARL